ncbi:LacI family DNA-binding transcriptional regulator [Actinocrinis sp.]|uniref:LacI family DNA-binding transcriptional regulator n=1 Tax=Actinocrinis sp. TaxID=1920516 RepID=UPI0032C2389E
MTVHNPGMSVTGHTSPPPTETTPAEAAGGPSRQRTRAVSIRDVAKAAGVSYQTVSRVINGNSYVRDSTRDRVQAAIAELGFRPNSAARALASGENRSLTVVTSNTTLYGYAATLQGVEEAARAAAFSVGISVLESSDDEHVRAAVDRAADSSGSVIVIAFDHAGTLALQAVPDGVPVAAAVETPQAPPQAGQPWVWIDDGEAARSATRYLLELGHPTVHYVAIPSTTHTSRRTAGWRAALAAAGVTAPEPVGAGWDALAGYQAGRTLARDPGVSAILCGNDDLALGVIRAMHEAGRSIPESVSVVGFDNAPQSAFYTPALTTVRMDFVELGRACFTLLHGEIEGTAPIVPHAVGRPELIVRESAGSFHHA